MVRLQARLSANVARLCRGEQAARRPFAGRLRKALFYRYNLNFLRFSGGLAEGEELGSNRLPVGQRSGRYLSV
jgi:hypothetical protein